MQARQGDIFFETVSKPPSKGEKLGNNVLAYGEVTGHSHRVISPSMEQLDSVVDEQGDIYVRCLTGPITIGHDEHDQVELPAKEWCRITRQREYDPLAAERERRVAD